MQSPKNYLDLGNNSLARCSMDDVPPFIAVYYVRVMYYIARRALWGHHKTLMPLILHHSLYQPKAQSCCLKE
jgi:hypothetical protein